MNDDCTIVEPRTAEPEKHLVFGYSQAFDIQAVLLARQIKERFKIGVVGQCAANGTQPLSWSGFDPA